MRIGGRWSSGNVQDRRGMGPGMVGGGLGAVVLTILALVFGVDPGVITQGDPTASAPAGAPPADDAAANEVRLVLGTTEGVWNAIFQEQFGQDYPEPQLVLFSGSVQSACGFAQAAMGPFYCPLDQQVYIDLSFWRDLEQLGGGSGDFAKAYVIAHEIGHHVQTVTGISEQVQQRRQMVSETEGNELSVRQELQADCFAGVWGNRVQSLPDVALDPGDVEEALTAATAIGDDRLQRQSQGYVVPESFTHGTSEQRMSWFRRGFQSGDIGQCDTFGAGAV